MFLNGAPQGPGPVDGVMAHGGQPVVGLRSEHQVQATLLQPLLEMGDLKFHDPTQFLLPEGMEDDDLVDAVEKLGTEVGPQGLFDPGFHLPMAAVVTGQIQNGLAGNVAGEDHDAVRKVHRPALAIRDAAVVQHLEQHVEHLGMGFLHLVQQDHRIGLAPHGLRELAPFLVAHVPGRGANEPGYGVALHILRHIKPHDGGFIVKELLRQGFAQFRLAHTGGTQEQKRGDGAPWIRQAGAGTLDGIGHAAHRLLLTHHPCMEPLLQIQQLLEFRLGKALYGDAGPLAYHLRHVLLADGLPQQSFLVALELPFSLLETLLQFGQGAVLQLRSLVEVVAAFGLLQLDLYLFNLFLQGLEIVQSTLLLCPLGHEGALLLRQIGQILVDARQPLFAGRIAFLGEGKFLHLQL